MPDDLWRKRVIEIRELIYLGLLLRDSVVTFLFLLFTFALFHVIAKFHYTDPTGPNRTGPDQTKSAHVVGYELNPTTRARPDPTGPARTWTRTDFFAAKLRWVRAGLRQSPCGSVRVRAGPVGPV